MQTHVGHQPRQQDMPFSPPERKDAFFSRRSLAGSTTSNQSTSRPPALRRLYRCWNRPAAIKDEAPLEAPCGAGLLQLASGLCLLKDRVREIRQPCGSGERTAFVCCPAASHRPPLHPSVEIHIDGRRRCLGRYVGGSGPHLFFFPYSSPSPLCVRKPIYGRGEVSSSWDGFRKQSPSFFPPPGSTPPQAALPGGFP
jgi:hypothetical protein